MKSLICLAVVLSATTARVGRTRTWVCLPEDPGQAPHPAVVRVMVSEGEGMSLGSGSLVAVSRDHGLVVTNWHVVRDARGQIVVVFADGFRSAATVLATDSDWDLAALGIWRPKVEPIPLAAEAPQPGETLTIAGYGPGSYRAITGRCIQYVSPGKNHPYEMIELSATARDGDSGGPILNSRGELAGVLFGATSGFTAGSHSGRVRRFLASVADKFGTLQPAPRTTSHSLHSNPAAVARQTEPTPEETTSRPGPVPVAATAARASPSGGATLPQSSGDVSYDGWAVSLSVLEAENGPLGAKPEAGETLTWRDVAGTTRGEQIKTVLAAIGLLAILFCVLRLLSMGRGN